MVPSDPVEAAKIWWGDVNMPMTKAKYASVLQRAKDYLNNRLDIFVVDGYIGADPKYRFAVRIFCTRAYHSLFMHNMLIRPTPEELKTDFENPDFVIYNAGEFYANRGSTGDGSRTCIAFDFEANTAAILGTQYAGEMKKGLFSLMHHKMPDIGVCSLHSSCTEGEEGDVTLFFGLSGTGKTTLSADPKRLLIGDDEHCWTDEGIFNIEGGCYAKVAGLERKNEPEIYDAIRFGSVLENVKFSDGETREVDYHDTTITPNTRVAYPIHFIPNAKEISVCGHPTNIIFLTCDAFGVFPPITRLDSNQSMYHFINGYTSKVAGTEIGMKSNEPLLTFSACYGEPFLVRHPSVYAELLADKIEKYNTKVWMINTGWVKGKFGVGTRISLAHTRKIIDAIHSGELDRATYTKSPLFGLDLPDKVEGIPADILDPAQGWKDKEAYMENLTTLASKFVENFKKYEKDCSPGILEGGPKL